MLDLISAMTFFIDMLEIYGVLVKSYFNSLWQRHFVETSVKVTSVAAEIILFDFNFCLRNPIDRLFLVTDIN